MLAIEGEVAWERCGRPWDAGQCLLCARLVASVQDHFVAPADELFGGLAAEPVSRACDQHLGHQTSTKPPSTVTIVPLL